MNSQNLADPYPANPERRIRCNITNSFLTPSFYDATESEARFEEQELRLSPLKKPRFQNRKGSLLQPMYHPYPKKSELFRIIYLIEGSGLLISQSGDEKLISKGTVVILPATHDVDILLGRGLNHAILAHWEPESPFVSSQSFNRVKTFVIHDASPLLQQFTDLVAKNPEIPENDENFFHAWINLVLSEHKDLESNQSFSLLPSIDQNLIGLIDLVKAIKQNPEFDWNLNASADFAGYSPFHLSRTFRASIGVGLPTFVELCRTEVAIDKLLATNDPINIISCECGFGSSQAMRSAIRQYTGLLPTEIRGRDGE